MGFPACEATSGCPYPVDIILESSDGKQFGAHCNNLELYTDAFPSVETGVITNMEEDVVKLAESADVVSLMLQFMHNQVQPDCDKLDSKLLLAFAKAAEKYGMYPAFEACKKGMRSRTTDTPLEVLLFKARYDLKDIDRVARSTLDMPMDDVVAVLTNAPEIFIIWSRYREKWRGLFPKYKELIAAGPTSGNPYRAHNASNTCMRRRLRQILAAFLDDDPIVSIEKVDNAVTACRSILSCPRCSITETDKEWAEWRLQIAGIIDRLPKWTDFL